MKRNELSNDSKREIEHIFCREVEYTRFGSVLSFVDFTDADLNDFRILFRESSLLLINYIMFLLKDGVPFSLVMSFVVTVIEQNFDVQNWIEHLSAEQALKMQKWT